MDSKERNERNDKKELKNYVFPFRIFMRNGLEGFFFAATQRKISKLILHDHEKISNNHAKCSRKAKLVLMHF